MDPSHERAHGSVLRLAESPDGTVWAGTTLGVFRYDGTDWHWNSVPMDLSEGRSFAIHSNGSLLYGTRAGVAIYSNGEWKDIDLGAGVSKPYAESIECTRDGAIWIGTRDGVFRSADSAWSEFIETSEGVRFSFAAAFPGNEQYPPIAIDQRSQIVFFDGNEWIGMPVGQTAPPPVGVKAPWNGMLTVQYSDEIVRYDLEGGAIRERIEIPSALQKLSLFQSSSGDLWLYGDRILRVWRDPDWIEHIGRLGPDWKKTILIDETADGALLAAAEERAAVLSNDRVTFLDTDIPAMHGRTIRMLLGGRDGSIWLGTRGGGLAGFNGNTRMVFTSEDGMLNNTVSCLYESADGTLWVGSGNSGISSYRDGRWLTYTNMDGLLEGRVQAIGEHPRGVMWFFVKPGGFSRYEMSPGAPNTQIVAHQDVVVRGGVGVFSFKGTDMWKESPEDQLAYSWRIASRTYDRITIPWSRYDPRTTVVSEPLPPGAYRFEVRAADKARNVDSTPAVAEFRVDQVFWLKPGFFIPIAVLLFAILCLAVALFLHQIKLRRLATVDELTGIWNRRHFMHILDQEFSRAARYEFPLSVLMIDLDHFKTVNDNHGHNAGDRVLFTFARAAQHVLRDVDAFGRVGGEEFAVCLPHTGLDGARSTGERLRAAVKDIGIPSRNETIKITVSIGVAAIGPGTIEATDLLQDADMALYAAKEGGRNRVVCS